MARKAQQVSLDFAFFVQLWQFYKDRKKQIKEKYKEATSRFLAFTAPENATSFLRQPQYEALEMYIFLKEYLGNKSVDHLFKDWLEQQGNFKTRDTALVRAGQNYLWENQTKQQFEVLYERMRSNAREYPNYIFALTMGTGKTILMATCIYYEFILANKYPKDKQYCKNALVFAPDKTVLQSLREIQSFDLSKVVPGEYVNLLTTQVKYHYLDEAGTALSVLDNSAFNIIVSNTQKVILKKQNKQRTAAEKMFSPTPDTYQDAPIYAEYADLYISDEPDNEADLTTNQRFEKLKKLSQLGIYVDEAHHAFGASLAKDMGLENSKTSLRLTIDKLAASLKAAGTQVVGCYNYTGTPYVGKEVLPEVVYAFGLQESIQKKYLKKASILSYTNTKSSEFVDLVIKDFIEQDFYKERHEGMLPKLAFFAATIDELQNELRPAVESALAKHGIDSSTILVNVGDEKITSNDDIREFNRLDTVASKKQFILLVNKGREGWNCRSLFGVALFRSPQSRIFVLQATMRCLRSIGNAQQTAKIYLSEANRLILDEELQQNFHISVEELGNTGKEHQRYDVTPVPPPVIIKLQRIHRQFKMTEKPVTEGQKICLELDKAVTDQYKLLQHETQALEAANSDNTRVTDITDRRKQRTFCELTLVAETARYLNRSCLELEEILKNTEEGFTEILTKVNQYNDLLYDWIIPRLFNALYDVTRHDETESYEVELVKIPPSGVYQLSANPDLVVQQCNTKPEQAAKSFHLDTYCFDSEPEKKLFWQLIQDGRVKKLYFTGMLTHGQSDFFVQYIDPETHSVRSYYPDFLVEKNDGQYIIVEVKGDNKIDDPVVLAKQDFAEQMAEAAGMVYKVISGSDAMRGLYEFLVSTIVSPALLPA